jgi:3-deoxy-7-phosphoheptulonate synthase
MLESSIEDRNLSGIRRLPPPRALKEALPLTTRSAATVLAARHALRACLRGEDPRLVVIVGPCSVHDPDSALEYGRRLARVAEPASDVLLVVMRTYFEKPRTTVGWKGLINDPHLDGTRDVPEGLRRARRLLLALGELGVPCASEMLDPFTPQFVADLLAWASIGARTSESQPHRELASGLSMPVGFKNGTDGSLDPACNAIVAARHPHSFLGICSDGASAVVSTRGNPDCHLVLRGGSAGPNHDAGSVARAVERVGSDAAGRPLRRPVMVDCSHGNSGKDHRRQAGVCRAVLDQVRSGQKALLGLMLESHLEAGRQDWTPGDRLERGVSITDACIGWKETEQLLGELAEGLRSAPR